MVSDKTYNQPIKIYIMAAPCSGKTTFAKTHKYYRKIKIVDVKNILIKQSFADKILTRICNRLGLSAKNRNILHNIPEDDQAAVYYDTVFTYLRSSRIPVCVLGRIGPQDYLNYLDMTFASVLIPDDDHRRNTNARKMRFPNAVFTNYEDVIEFRDKITAYSNNFSIPIFSSFQGAIDGVINSFDKG